MVVSTNPGSSSHHRHDGNNHCHNTPAENDLGSVCRHVVLEDADNRVDEPGDTRDSTAGVDTAKMLQKTGEEDTPPQRRPL